jgi:hypothetical protein
MWEVLSAHNRIAGRLVAATFVFNVHLHFVWSKSANDADLTINVSVVSMKVGVEQSLMQAQLRPENPIVFESHPLHDHTDRPDRC